MKKFWKEFKFRFTLFRILVLKNILLWLLLLGIISLICVFTGAINKDTPIFGFMVYPVLKPLCDSINNLVAERRVENFMTFLRILGSIVASVGIFAVKVKTIAKEDIKSDKLKIELIRHGLCFSPDGRLVKRKKLQRKQQLEAIENENKKNEDEVIEVNEAAFEDIDEQTVAEENNASKGLIGGTVAAIKEFGVLMSSDFVGNGDSCEEEFTKKDEENDTEEVVEALEETAKEDDSLVNAFADGAIETVEKEIEKTENDETLHEETKKKRVSLFRKLVDFFKSIRRTKLYDDEELETDEDDDILDEIESEESLG